MSKVLAHAAGSSSRPRSLFYTAKEGGEGVATEDWRILYIVASMCLGGSQREHSCLKSVRGHLTKVEEQRSLQKAKNWYVVNQSISVRGASVVVEERR